MNVSTTTPGNSGRGGGRGEKITESQRIIAPGVTHRGSGASDPVGILPKTFRDTLIGTDQPFFAGDQWFACPTPISVGTTGSGMGTAYNRGGSGLTLTAMPGNGQCHVMLVPIPVNYQAMNGKRGVAQFAEYKIKSDSSTLGPPALLTRIGPMVFGQPNSTTCYYAKFRPESLKVSLSRVYGNSTPHDDLISADFTFAYNDLVRIKVKPSTPSNEVSLYINGVLKATVTDSDANRPLWGVPGIYHAFNSTAVSQTIANYFGGMS